MKDVNVVIGSGSIGQAIARRVSTGKHVLLADVHEKNAAAAAKTLSVRAMRSAPRSWTSRIVDRSRHS